MTDLVQALQDNGRASDGVAGAPADGSRIDPIGVKKESYVDALYADGQAYAQYTTTDMTAALPVWYAGVSAGEPYSSANPLVPEALTQLSQYRSAYYLPVPPASAQVPVLDEQGLTDPLFNGFQALSMQQKLAPSNYPLWVVLGDLGHPYASNPHQLWVSVNGIANQWLSTVLSGGTPTLAADTLFSVDCLSGQTAGSFSATSPAGIATSEATFQGVGSQTTASATPAGAEAAQTDPILNGEIGPGGCRTMSTQTDPGVAAWTWTVPAATEIAGAPTATVDVAMTGTDAELAARLWDVRGNNQTLITRAVYRLTSASPTSTQTLQIPLWPTAWQVGAGDQLKLELTQNDSSTWRPDNLASTLTLSSVSLTVPER